jgi:hypothetical protein
MIQTEPSGLLFLYKNQRAGGWNRTCQFGTCGREGGGGEIVKEGKYGANIVCAHVCKWKNDTY